MDVAACDEPTLCKGDQQEVARAADVARRRHDERLARPSRRDDIGAGPPQGRQVRPEMFRVLLARADQQDVGVARVSARKKLDEVVRERCRRPADRGDPRWPRARRSKCHLDGDHGLRGERVDARQRLDGRADARRGTLVGPLDFLDGHRALFRADRLNGSVDHAPDVAPPMPRRDTPPMFTKEQYESTKVN